MKTIKMLLVGFLLCLLGSVSNAQQATENDYIATWTGIGDNGVTYTLDLKQNNEATLKADATILDVTWWKLKFDATGAIVLDKNGNSTLRLICNTPVQTPVNNMMLTAAPSGSTFKTYVTQVFYDLTAQTMSVTLEIGTIKPVSILFTK